MSGSTSVASPFPPDRSTKLARYFYRLVKTNPYTLDDFKSHHELGMVFRRPLDTEAIRLSQGLSVSDDPTKLRRMAQMNPELVAFIVMLRIDDEAPVRWEKTTRRRDHYTLWGRAEDVAACVVRIEPLRQLFTVD